MDKSALITAVIAVLEQRLEILSRASKAARHEATHADSKAESKYDTRGLEAGYLANGQARQAEEVALAIAAWRALAPTPFEAGTAIGPGALVTLRMGGETDLYFIGPGEGGLTVPLDGREVTVISAETPLAQRLLGRRAGERLMQPAATITAVS